MSIGVKEQRGVGVTERRRAGVPESSTFSSSFCIRRDFKHRARWSVRFPPRPIKAPAPPRRRHPNTPSLYHSINIPLPHYSNAPLLHYPIRRHAVTPTPHHATTPPSHGKLGHGIYENYGLCCAYVPCQVHHRTPGPLKVPPFPKPTRTPSSSPTPRASFFGSTWPSIL
jgi:hypothetical protein